MRLSAIGDVTHVLPTLRTLQHNWPECRISWIIGRTEASLVGDIPGVEFIVFDKGLGWKAYRDLARALKGRTFDVLLHMQVSLRASIAGLLVRAPVRVGFDRSRAKNGQWLFTNRRIQTASRQHVLEGFLEFPKALGLDETVLRWDIPIPEKARAFAVGKMPDGEKWLAINPCSSNRARNWRNWSVENYAAVIDYAKQKHGLNTVLTGGPAEEEKTFGRRIEEAATHKPLNLIGGTNLKELLAILERSTVMISPDTGPAHMAGAAGTPVIGLYASSNPRRTGPYSSLHLTVDKYPEAVRRELGKSVDEVRWGQRVRNPRVMELIDVAEVQERLDLALAETGKDNRSA